jgi:hypothetical protein
MMYILSSDSIIAFVRACGTDEDDRSTQYINRVSSYNDPFILSNNPIRIPHEAHRRRLNSLWRGARRPFRRI